jgi:hypothetical protein
MAMLGVSIHVVERCLNHVSGSFAGLVSVYQRHNYEREKRAAFEAWARQLAAIVSGKPAGDNVVDLNGKRAG